MWCQTWSGSFRKLHTGILILQFPPVEQIPWQVLLEMRMLNSPSHPWSLPAEHFHLHSSAPIYKGFSITAHIKLNHTIL